MQSSHGRGVASFAPKKGILPLLGVNEFLVVRNCRRMKVISREVHFFFL